MFLGDKKGILCERKGVLPFPVEECILLGLLSCIKVSSNHLYYLFTWEIFPVLWRRNHLYIPGRWIIIFIFRDIISSADNIGIACLPNKLSSESRTLGLVSASFFRFTYLTFLSKQRSFLFCLNLASALALLSGRLHVSSGTGVLDPDGHIFCVGK